MNNDSQLIFEAYRTRKSINEAQEVDPKKNMPETDMTDPEQATEVQIGREILKALQMININDPNLAYCIVGIQKAKQLAGKLMEMHLASSGLANSKSTDDLGDASDGTPVATDGKSQSGSPDDGPSSYVA